MAFKSLVMAELKEEAGINVRANPFVYKAMGAGAASHAVVFENDGLTGKYNRANRSLHHFIENAAPVFLCLVLVGHLFPWPSFVCVAAFCAGRVLHQVGYAGGYGGHGAGFGIATLASTTLEGLVLLVAIAGTGWLA